MKIIPAIDLINQKCVRLYKGDFNQEKSYDISPLDTAIQFEYEGAKSLHIVDLDKAKEGFSNNLEIIYKIAKKTNLSIQTGGGIREKSQITSLLENGIEKVIIGSLASSNLNLVKEWLDYFGNEKIVLAFDIEFIEKEPIVLTQAWQNKSSLNLWEVLELYPPNIEILCTDIEKDGTLKSPNFFLYEKILEKFPNIKLQASGGISNIEDLILLKEKKIPSVIVGKALYEKKINLKEAILKC